MRTLVILLLLVQTTLYSQSDTPVFNTIEEYDYKLEPSFYVVKLDMQPTVDNTIARVNWDAHRSISKFVVEMYDKETGELFYRKLITEKHTFAPIEAQVSVAPVHNKLIGKPKRITLTSANAKRAQEERKKFNEALKELQNQNYNNSSYQNNEPEIPWRWIIRGAGLLALLIGFIVKISGKSDSSNYDRRNRR